MTPRASLIVLQSDPEQQVRAVVGLAMSDKSDSGRSMSISELRAQASRVNALLADVWNDDFPEVFPDVAVDEMLGMALAHAVHQGWIEPEPDMSPYLESAETLLGSADLDD